MPLKMKKKLLRIIVEAGGILVLSLLMALTVNAVRDNGLPLLRAYTPSASADPAPSLDLPEIDGATLNALMAGGMVTLVDARAGSVYRSGHIPGALSLPLGEKETRYPLIRDALVPGRTIVVYCIDRDCLDSAFLAAWLVEQGYHDVMVFPEGFAGWRGAGNPVEESR